MRIVVALLSGMGWLLAGCAAQRTGSPPAETAASAPAAASPCPPAAALSRWREMTWAEYYMDVEERAWRRGGVVIWIEPPRVSKARSGELSCR